MMVPSGSQAPLALPFLTAQALLLTLTPDHLGPLVGWGLLDQLAHCTRLTGQPLALAKVLDDREALLRVGGGLDAPPFVLPAFVPLGGDLFVCDAGAQMQFRRDAAGAITALRLDLNRASGLVLERR